MKILKNISILGKKVTYTLTESKTELGVVYGVKITSLLFDIIETSEVLDISADYEKTLHFYHLLIDCSVLPAALKEVTYDYISAIYSA